MKRLALKLLFIPLIGIALTVTAQSNEQKLALDPFISISHYSGDLGSELAYFEQNDINPGFGASLNYYLNPYFDLSGELAYNRIDFSGNNGHFDTEMYSFSALGKFKFANGTIISQDAAVAPYLVAGPGITYAQIKATNTDAGNMDNDLRTLHLVTGAGIKFRISDNIAAFSQIVFVNPGTDKLDGAVENGARDVYLQSMGGLSFKLGNISDSDGDGVLDKNDKCPKTSLLAEVSPDGCPVDADADGIPDYLDKCPMIAGLKATEGCPDKDGDGVIDSQDACPDVAGNAFMFGCPDTDNDGVADNLDQCPEEAGSRFNMGCPAKVDTVGVSTTLIQQMGFAAKDITFETNKDVLRPSSETSLNDVVKVLQENKNLNLTIEGHTDNVGEDNHNMTLSNKRAKAVMNYLVEAGIETSRIAAIGYGETRPIAENDNETGRAENRRVVLILNVNK